MKKVISITLNSIVFAIEDDAYAALETYLSSVKSALGSSDDYAEVMEDIESAIADKFVAKKRSEKLAVTESDVVSVIAAMGSPADFGDAAANPVVEASTERAREERRLYRDTDNAVLGGVASGLAQYFSIDPVLVRLLFVITVFFSGIGIIAYIIFWVIVPAAETTTQKYAMRGASVTLEEISNKVKKNVNELDAVRREKIPAFWKPVRSVINRIFNVAGVLVRALLMVMRYVFGVAGVIGGALALAGLVSLYSVALLSEKVLLPNPIQEALQIILSTPLGWVAMTASFILQAIPMLVLVLAGGSLLVWRNLFKVTTSIALIVVWIVAVGVAGTSSVLLIEQVTGELDVLKLQQHHDGYDLRIDLDQVQFDVSVEHPPVDVVVTCTEEAKICADGSAVGRSGPDCSFAACPDEMVSETMTCSAEMLAADVCAEIYQPVCGLVDVQCITEPCPPIPETFSNACTACAHGNVSTYQAGACPVS